MGQTLNNASQCRRFDVVFGRFQNQVVGQCSLVVGVRTASQLMKPSMVDVLQRFTVGQGHWNWGGCCGGRGTCCGRGTHVCWPAGRNGRSFFHCPCDHCIAQDVHRLLFCCFYLFRRVRQGQGVDQCLFGCAPNMVGPPFHQFHRGFVRQMPSQCKCGVFGTGRKSRGYFFPHVCFV